MTPYLRSFQDLETTLANLGITEANLRITDANLGITDSKTTLRSHLFQFRAVHDPTINHNMTVLGQRQHYFRQIHHFAHTKSIIYVSIFLNNRPSSSILHLLPFLFLTLLFFVLLVLCSSCSFHNFSTPIQKKNPKKKITCKKHLQKINCNYNLFFHRQSKKKKKITYKKSHATYC